MVQDGLLSRVAILRIVGEPSARRHAGKVRMHLKSQNVSRSVVSCSLRPRDCSSPGFLCPRGFSRSPRFDPWVGKIPWRREWQRTAVCLPGVCLKSLACFLNAFFFYLLILFSMAAGCGRLGKTELCRRELGISALEVSAICRGIPSTLF